MESIEKLSHRIEEEIEDAEEYAKMALHYKETDPELAQTYITISGEEMKHMEMLHRQVARLISTYRKEHGEPPAPMQAVYDYVHKREIEKANKVHLLHQQYRQ